MENKVEKFAVAMIVNNRFGVLNRIAGLYAKRCYNIDNISAGTLDDPNYTRIPIVSTGDVHQNVPDRNPQRLQQTSGTGSDQ